MLTRIARISFHDGLVGKHSKACFKYLPMMNSFTNDNKKIYRRKLSNFSEADGRTGKYSCALWWLYSRLYSVV